MYVYLFQKDTAAAKRIVEELSAHGYRVRHEPVSPASLRKLRDKPPAAVLIDLSRAPSTGRDVGIFVRHYRKTRHVPIVFFGGEPGKVAQVKRYLPDAVYTDRHQVKTALKRAILCPPTAPVKPQSLLAGYSGTPLVKKLGIKPEFNVVLIDAPHDFQKALGKIPDGVVMKKRLMRQNDMVIWFVKSRKVLERRISKVANFVKQGGLWIVWPKRTSRISSDLSQKHVRAVGLNAGLVDYKVCAFDETWSGLKFAFRK
jgi:hypothetical protein